MRYLSIALEKLWREAHDNTGSKASRRNHRVETADLRAIADRSTRECMAPVLGILPERAEQNKDFEVDDLLPWSEKRSRGSRQRECWEPRLFCIGGLLSGYCFSEIAVYFLANVGYNAGGVWRLCFV